MKNYKIKLNNEAESKEAQELFFELGYSWLLGKVEIKYIDEPSLIATLNGISFCGDMDHFHRFDAKELTLPQLRDLVAQKKNEQGLISGADAKLAWAKGEIIEYSYVGDWYEIDAKTIIGIFDRKDIALRIKPRTIKLELEIPAPFEPKDGEEAWCLDGYTLNGYKKIIVDDFDLGIGFWQTEEEIKQVVAVLRGGIKG